LPNLKRKDLKQVLVCLHLVVANVEVGGLAPVVLVQVALVVLSVLLVLLAENLT
jgi:hypothetical protein